MYVQGVSTRKVAAITEKLCGLEVTTAQVSRAAQALDDELEKWRSRPLGETPYLILDARYEKVRHGGQVRSCAVLVAIGIGPDGKRSVLGVSVSLVGGRGPLAGLPGRTCRPGGCTGSSWSSATPTAGSSRPWTPG